MTRVIVSLSTSECFPFSQWPYRFQGKHQIRIGLCGWCTGDLRHYVRTSQENAPNTEPRCSLLLRLDFWKVFFPNGEGGLEETS